ncbi:MAG: hypothetical protein MUP41_03370 [Desulfobacterales bacterium]|nr:hypothetical protein [Desulfobacterales bacterium]
MAKETRCGTRNCGTNGILSGLCPCPDGAAASTAYTFFDENKIVVRRTECSYHAYRPEGMRSMCDDTGEGFMKGYMEADKNFVKTEKNSLSFHR